jgi:hemoglobin
VNDHPSQTAPRHAAPPIPPDGAAPPADTGRMATGPEAPGAIASAYRRLGGAATVRTAVDRFYALVLDDDELRPYFPADLTSLKRHQVALLTQVLGGPGRHEGRDMAAAHAALHVTGAHFDRVVDYLVGTLWILHAPADIIAAVAQAVTGLRADIVAEPDPGAVPAPAATHTAGAV